MYSNDFYCSFNQYPLDLLFIWPSSNFCCLSTCIKPLYTWFVVYLTIFQFLLFIYHLPLDFCSSFNHFPLLSVVYLHVLNHYPLDFCYSTFSMISVVHQPIIYLIPVVHLPIIHLIPVIHLTIPALISGVHLTSISLVPTVRLSIMALIPGVHI